LPKTTRDMSDRHESYIKKLIGGDITPGSGNQFNAQTDVKQPYKAQYYSFAADGKSTLAASITITLDMWEKLVEQAGHHEPLLPLRLYRNARLTESLDLVTLDFQLFAQILDDAQKYQETLKKASGLDIEI
jgi:hypothetical protein